MTTLQRFLVLPLAMGLITGALCGGIAWRYLPELDPIGIGLIVALAVWSAITGLTVLRDYWLPVVETRLGIDLDRDGVVGRPATEGLTDPDAMLAGAQQGAPLSLAHWKKQSWSRTRWEQARDVLLKQGLIQLRKAGSPSAGYELTRKGGAKRNVPVYHNGNETSVEV